jgi:hypothetical protein
VGLAPLCYIVSQITDNRQQTTGREEELILILRLRLRFSSDRNGRCDSSSLAGMSWDVRMWLNPTGSGWARPEVDS